MRAVQPRSRRVPGADGLALHVLEWSEEGVPLLFVHGFGNDAHVWDEIAPVVAPCYRVLALDLRGHGDSDHDPEHRYDYARFVADLECATEALGVDRLVLVGHSLGGRVSMLFAGRHPARLAGLVIVDAGPELDPRGTTRIRLDVRKQADASFASPGEYERALAHAYPAASASTLARLAQHGLRRRADGRFERKTDPTFYALPGQLDAAALAERERNTSRELWDALARVTCPTLVVRGAASDILSPDCADRMAEEVLAQGRLAVVPAAAHSVMIDNPGGFARALAAFALDEADDAA